MIRILRYQEHIVKFIKEKSVYKSLYTQDSNYEEFVNLNEHYLSIILLTVLNGLYGKKNKTYHGYHLASGIDLWVNMLLIKDNPNYYNNKYGKEHIDNFINFVPIYLFETISQHIIHVTRSMDKDGIDQKSKQKLYKAYHTLTNYVQKKLLSTVEHVELKGTNKPVKTDIINYRFSNPEVLNKHKKIKVIDKDVMIDYVDKTYGTVCKCVFVMAWIMGFGSEDMIEDLERLGTHLGLMFKLANDFHNLERDLDTVGTMSTNLIINYGIHQCFSLFVSSKEKFLEGCITLGINDSITLKEVIDCIEKKFDDQIENTSLDLQSKYTSYSETSGV